MDISELETHEYDVIVIGAGGAGLRAAIEASRNDKRTALVCKSLLGKAHTVMAEGGMAGSLANVDERDHWKVHFRDTMRGGKFLNSWRMAELHAKNAPDRIRELEEWGAVFDRTPQGKINQRNFGGHRYPRLAHVGDRTGLEMLRSLQDYGIHQGIDVFMECHALDLLKDGDKIAGMVGMWSESGRFLVMKGNAVIIATGGAGRAWEVTSNSWEYTGDGYAMAYEAGAELMDMEFTQFHPTGMVWPPSVKGTLVTEGVRGEGGVLKNSDDERFMFDNIPDRFAPETADSIAEAQKWMEGDRNSRRPPELLTRDVVARAILKQVREGRGSPHGGAFLDIATQRSDEDIKKKLPSMYHQFKVLAELDITRDPMEVGPTLHYMMGGIRVDPDSQMSTVPGLFACGEASAGMHGANRLGGNSLSDLVVFGQLAGKGAAEYAESLEKMPEAFDEQVESIIRRATDMLNRESGKNPYLLHDELRKNMQENVGIVREEEGLKKGIENLGPLKGSYKEVKAEGAPQYNPGLHQALSLRNLFITAEAVANAAYIREESRGAHTRIDHEGESEEWMKYNIVVRKNKDGEMETEKLERQEPEEELKRIAHSELEDLEKEVAEGRKAKT